MMTADGTSSRVALTICHLPFAIFRRQLEAGCGTSADHAPRLPARAARGWIWDDDYYVTKNHNLRNARRAEEHLDEVRTQDGGTPQYYPVTHTTFWVEHHLWGLRPARVSPRQHPAARGERDAALVDPAPARSARRVARGGGVCGASGARRIGRVGDRAEERAVRVLLPRGVLTSISPLAGFARLERADRSEKLRYAIVLALLHLRAAEQVRHRIPAGGDPADHLVEARPHRVRDVAPLVPMFVLGIAMGMLTSWMERDTSSAQGPDWELSSSSASSSPGGRFGFMR